MYELYGVVEFYDKDVMKKMGYDYKNLYLPSHPVLVYTKNSDTNDKYIASPYFAKINDSYKYIHPETIKNIYNLESAKEAFPELFI
jgi:hypothetical protein